jgi:hypothetical protein
MTNLKMLTLTTDVGLSFFATLPYFERTTRLETFMIRTTEAEGYDLCQLARNLNRCASLTTIETIFLANQAPPRSVLLELIRIFQAHPHLDTLEWVQDTRDETARGIWFKHHKRRFSVEVKHLVTLCAYSTLPRLRELYPRMFLGVDVIRRLDDTLGRLQLKKS